MIKRETKYSIKKHQVAPLNLKPVYKLWVNGSFIKNFSTYSAVTGFIEKCLAEGTEPIDVHWIRSIEDALEE